MKDIKQGKVPMHCCHLEVFSLSDLCTGAFLTSPDDPFTSHTKVNIFASSVWSAAVPLTELANCLREPVV